MTPLQKSYLQISDWLQSRMEEFPDDIFNQNLKGILDWAHSRGIILNPNPLPIGNEIIRDSPPPDGTDGPIPNLTWESAFWSLYNAISGLNPNSPPVIIANSDKAPSPYLECHRKLNFRVGERVRLITNVGEQRGWMGFWFSHLDSFVGNICVVEKDLLDFGIRLKGIPYLFPATSLELVPQDTYRPFRNDEEFFPHRNRWVEYKSVLVRVDRFTNKCVLIAAEGIEWSEAFTTLKFADDFATRTPFGVKE